MIWNPKREHLPDFIVSTGNVGPCSGTTCKAEIGWAKTKNGKWQPFDLDVDPKTGKHLPHHMTCPDVESFRKGGAA